jgi:hypothetical protein
MDDIRKALLFELEVLAEASREEYAASKWDNFDAHVLKFNEILRKLKKLGGYDKWPAIESVPSGERGMWATGTPAEREKLREVSIKSDQLLAELKLDMPGVERDGKAREYFPTPPGATWGDVRVKFVDGHRVSICVREVKRIYNYTQMGMYNKKNGEPTVQWHLLRELSYGHGMIDIPRKRDPKGPRERKQREILAKDLRRFFGIKGDPIQTLEDKGTWQTRFQLDPAH